MTKFKIFKVRVPEEHSICFEKLMKAHGWGFSDDGEFRVTNLEAWAKGIQKNVMED